MSRTVITDIVLPISLVISLVAACVGGAWYLRGTEARSNEVQLQSQYEIEKVRTENTVRHEALLTLIESNQNTILNKINDIDTSIAEAKMSRYHKFEALRAWDVFFRDNPSVKRPPEFDKIFDQ